MDFPRLAHLKLGQLALSLLSVTMVKVRRYRFLSFRYKFQNIYFSNQLHIEVGVTQHMGVGNMLYFWDNAWVLGYHILFSQLKYRISMIESDVTPHVSTIVAASLLTDSVLI